MTYRPISRALPGALALALAVALIPQAVFAAPSAPSALQAYTGGGSTALRWNPSASGGPVARYDIFRNGVKIGSVTPGFHADFPEKNGNGYIDANVTAGQSYSYQVQAVDGAGAPSPLSAALSVAYPTSGTPIPNVTLDYSQATDLQTWMQGTVLPFVKSWYPKISDQIAFPDYAPPPAYTIKIDPAYTGVAYVSGTTMVVSAVYARNNPNDLGMFLHESTHVAQQHKRGDWITEGMADWAREFVLHDRDPIPLPVGKTYLSGYSEGSYFLNWISKQYNLPDFVRILNIAKHEGGQIDDDPDAAFVSLTGKTPNQLWREMTGAPVAGAALNFPGIAGRCVGSRAGRVELRVCDENASGQQWTFARIADQTLNLKIGGQCMDIVSSGTANGSKVQLWSCNNTGAQKWQSLGNGTYRNPQSGRCLDVPNGTNVVGTQLQIWDCNASAAQVIAPVAGRAIAFVGLAGYCVGNRTGRQAEIQACADGASDQQWNVSNNSDATISLKIAGGAECLDISSSGTANGSKVQLWGCNGTGAQKWQHFTDGTLRNPQSGRCLDVPNGAAVPGTQLQIWDCNAGNAQRVRLP
ncbi:ricin-type beta-trefoil lectin domain protein [Lysobacter sp. CA199]|uniref:ricin-type beta-trefoil lectin domain protein n=1 Tax=Lysobacter sp. CA199 TaxID=3455608 RepID=UPI003F8D6276